MTRPLVCLAAALGLLALAPRADAGPRPSGRVGRAWNALKARVAPGGGLRSWYGIVDKMGRLPRPMRKEMKRALRSAWVRERNERVEPGTYLSYGTGTSLLANGGGAVTVIDWGNQVFTRSVTRRELGEERSSMTRFEPILGATTRPRGSGQAPRFFLEPTVGGKLLRTTRSVAGEQHTVMDPTGKKELLHLRPEEVVRTHRGLELDFRREGR